MTYSTIILDSLSYLPPKARPLLKKLARDKHLIIRSDSKYASQFRGAFIYETDEDLINAINETGRPDLSLTVPSENIRYRHVVKGNDHYYIIFNEEASDVTTGVRLQAPDSYREGDRTWIDPFTAKATPSAVEEIVTFKPHELRILRVNGTPLNSAL